jgi:hypothetical protein
MEQHNILDPFVGLVSIFMMKAVLLTRLQHLSADRTGSALSPQHLASRKHRRLTLRQLPARNDLTIRLCRDLTVRRQAAQSMPDHPSARSWAACSVRLLIVNMPHVRGFQIGLIK